MRVLILGIDGYLGWPTAMYFSARGHSVYGIDNYFKRQASRTLNAEALISNPNLHERVKVWKGYDNREITVEVGDVAIYSTICEVFRSYMPDVVIHYAEQPSAPWSMIDQVTAQKTLTNNLISTLNLAHAVKKYNPNCHIIKLGTMGEYGTPNLDIPEGWFDLEYKGRIDRVLFPRQAGSLYHATKIMDTDMLWFYTRTWGLRVTDLMQGPVYGLVTNEMYQIKKLHPIEGEPHRTWIEHCIEPKLLTNFHYDEVFGTVLNRFIVQALIGKPLTIYGKGGQTRGHLNIKDTMQCIYLAAINPPEQGKLEVYNQITETFSVLQLAEIVKETVERYFDKKVTYQHLRNPRVEKEKHYYNPTYTKLLDLGLKPTLLNDVILKEMIEIVNQYIDNVNEECIFIGYNWK